MPILTSLALASIRGFGFSSGGAPILDVVTTFTSTRSFIIPEGVTELDYLIVAGGGGGGTGYSGGGGGAGGVRIGSGLSVTAGQLYTFTIGSGGTARSRGTPGGPAITGGNGGGSSIEGGSPTVIHLGANGGGGGGTSGDTANGTPTGTARGQSGGSGGGGASAKTNSGLGKSLTLESNNGHASFPHTQDSPFPGQGSNGGVGLDGSSTVTLSAGGGGALQDGFSPTPAATATFAGNGGNGLSSTISGSSQF